MIGIGPYDYWAVEYGYSFAEDSKAVLDRVAEPELQFATDEDTWGPDPLARQYDLGKNPLDYAQEQMRLVKHHREQLVEKFVKDGDSWSKARRGYAMTLSVQMNAVSMMANWIGGVHVYRDKKGDKNGRAPLEVVAADRQRAALAFVIENTFHDDVYGLTPALLSRMTVDKWLDEDLLAAMEDPAWPVHDRIMGLQAAALTMIMNPTTLQRVYDNEFRVASDTDMITLPEMLTKLGADIWSELDKIPEAEHAARTPVISSLRRNLQREHLERLIDLSMPGAGLSAAYKPISDLARAELRTIQGKAKELLEKGGDKIDPYSKAHVTDIEALIAKVLDAQYIYNANAMGGSATIFFQFGKEAVRAE